MASRAGAMPRAHLVEIGISSLIVLPPDKGFQPTPVPQDNLVDRHIIPKLNDLRIKPSEITDDERFLRRLNVDLTGIQPSPEQVLADIEDVVFQTNAMTSALEEVAPFEQMVARLTA